MFYEKISKKNNHREVLIMMGYLSEDNPQLACWSSNSNNSMVSFKADFMFPNRYWISIKDDMLYICRSGFNGKVLCYYANIELKNVRFIKRITYVTSSFVFEVKNESGVQEFRVNPLTLDEEYYAEMLADYIKTYKHEV